MDLIVLLILILIYRLSKKNRDRDKSNINDALNHSSLLRLNDIWEPDLLDHIMYVEIGNHPHLEPYLTRAYKKRKQLLHGFSIGDSNSIGFIKNVIASQVNNAKSIQELAYLKFKFSWVVERAPYLSTLFTLKSQQTQAKSKVYDKKNLLGACQTKEEVKKRFRSLALQNHPDHGGSKAAMREIIRQYEEALMATDAR